MSSERPKMIAQTRERTGSRYALRLRRGGKLPAVIYGHGQDPAHVALDTESIEQALNDGSHLLDIDVTGVKVETCLIKDIQYDFLGDHIIHVDLTRVDLSEEVEVNVPLILKGDSKAPGLKEAGAILENPMTDLQVKCRADAIPREIAVDVSTLEVGQSVSVGDLVMPAGVEAISDAEAVIAQISVAVEEELEVEGEEEVAGGDEPEVITKGKEEEEAEGGAE